jgi:queuine/archaeosine tRNA-ribosyltransferase
LHFYLELMSDIRHSIREQKFTNLKKKVKEMYDE